MKSSEFCACCLAIILALTYAVDSLSTESAADEGGLQKRELVYQSSQSEAEAAAKARQANSYLNIGGAPSYYPTPTPAIYSTPLYQAPYYGNSLHYSRQSSEAAASAATRNQHSRLISNGAYPVIAGPPYWGTSPAIYPSYYPDSYYSAPYYGGGNLQYAQQSSEASASALARNQHTGLSYNGAYPFATRPTYWGTLPAAYPSYYSDSYYPAPYYGASNLQYAQQSSEASASALSRNQYTGLAYNGAYPFAARPAYWGASPAVYPLYYPASYYPTSYYPAPYYGAGSLQYAQQSSEAAASAASRSQYTGLAADNGYTPYAV